MTTHTFQASEHTTMGYFTKDDDGVVIPEYTTYNIVNKFTVDASNPIATGTEYLQIANSDFDEKPTAGDELIILDSSGTVVTATFFGQGETPSAYDVSESNGNLVIQLSHDTENADIDQDHVLYFVPGTLTVALDSGSATSLINFTNGGTQNGTINFFVMGDVTNPTITSMHQIGMDDDVNAASESDYVFKYEVDRNGSSNSWNTWVTFGVDENGSQSGTGDNHDAFAFNFTGLDDATNTTASNGFKLISVQKSVNGQFDFINIEQINSFAKGLFQGATFRFITGQTSGHLELEEETVSTLVNSTNTNTWLGYVPGWITTAVSSGINSTYNNDANHYYNQGLVAVANQDPSRFEVEGDAAKECDEAEFDTKYISMLKAGDIIQVRFSVDAGDSQVYKMGESESFSDKSGDCTTKVLFQFTLTDSS